MIVCKDTTEATSPGTCFAWASCEAGTDRPADRSGETQPPSDADSDMPEHQQIEVNPEADCGGRTPCWVIRGCAAEARSVCPAYLNPSRPCWELDDTLCKKLLKIDSCFACEVYQRAVGGPGDWADEQAQEDDGPTAGA